MHFFAHTCIVDPSLPTGTILKVSRRSSAHQLKQTANQTSPAEMALQPTDQTKETVVQTAVQVKETAASEISETNNTNDTVDLMHNQVA